MMTFTFRLFSIAMLSSLLAGCHDSYTHDFLLQHPKVLQSEIAKCIRNTEYSTYCDMVKHTSDELVALESMRADDQERFGKQVLSAEQSLAVMQSALMLAKQNYEKSPQQADLKLKFEMAKMAYKAQLQKVHTLLAVIGETGAVGN